MINIASEDQEIVSSIIGLMATVTTGGIKGSDHFYIGDLGKIPLWNKTHLTDCIGEIIGFHWRLTDKESSYIHQYLIRKWGIIDTIIGNSPILYDLVSYHIK